ncbi:carbohydrate ABC transporter permease [Caproiciproducens galactitolivorans]|uniref:Sugar ABC transporter permease n=1 Tax=Caproiciproducens galactitolivorans TaxID=642589 RepID=A0ABT4BQY8_9FIRM|nr:sugar ABC transporter permease [Caproiciproducens galactitolivorans]MCY1713292.1 sugar ABC transporter permease [Caproiciproducens galactitolivorans]
MWKTSDKVTHHTLEKKLNRWGWIFVSLSAVLISVFVFIPMVGALIMSFQTGKGVNAHFGGLTNYIRLFTDQTVGKALGNTFIYLIIQVPIMIVLALIISVLLNDDKLKGRTFFRIAIFLPCITSLVSYSLIMKNIFSNDGIFNQMLAHIGLSPILWTTDPFWAKVLIIISITWRWTGYNMVFYLSGMQGIEPSIYEAAEIDGANAVKKFTHMTIPLLKPIILFTTITSTIGTLQLFDEVQNITQGGPANGTVTISQYIYNLCFKYTPNFGYACAVAFIVVILIVILSMIQMKVGGKDNQ